MGGGRRGSPRHPPWTRTTWCPWSRPDQSPGRPPCGPQTRSSGGGRRHLRPGPPGCSPLLRGSPGGLAGPPSRWAAELGEGGLPGGSGPWSQHGRGGCAAPPPQPDPGRPPPSCASPCRGGLKCGAGGCCRPRTPRPPTRPLSSASSSSPPPPATSSFLSGTLTSPSGDSRPFPTVNPFGEGRGSGRGRAWKLD